MSEEIPEQLLTQMLLEQVPEYYGSKEKYQPADVGSMIANMSLLEDRLGLMADPLMAILAGTFDYSTLIGESDFDEKAPDTAQADWYRSTQLYPELFMALDSGLTASEAALQQYASEGMPDITEQLQKGEAVDPRYNDLKAIADASVKQIADRRGWEQRRDSAGYAPSETGKLLEKMGMSSSAYTPDEYYSDSIGQHRQDRQDAAAAMSDVRTYDDATEQLQGELSGLTTGGYGNRRSLDGASQQVVPTSQEIVDASAGNDDGDDGGGSSQNRLVQSVEALSNLIPGSQVMNAVTQPWYDKFGITDAKNWVVDEVGKSAEFWGGELADSARFWGDTLTDDSIGNQSPILGDIEYVVTGERGNWGPGSNSMDGSTSGTSSTSPTDNTKARQRALRTQIEGREDRTADFNKAYKKEAKSSTDAWHESQAIKRQRSTGRTQQKDQAMTLASYLLSGR